jgi:hypothetical protein
MVAASLLAITVALSPIAVYAGAGHDVEMMIFDPTETKFEQYKSEMHVTKTIEIVMSDEMRFRPSVVNVKKVTSLNFFIQIQGINARICTRYLKFISRTCRNDEEAPWHETL